MPEELDEVTGICPICHQEYFCGEVTCENDGCDEADIEDAPDA